MATRYYAWMAVSEDGTEAEIRSVHRMVSEPGVLRLERFDEEAGEWVDNPGLIAVTGAGGDHNYFEITQEEAAAYLLDAVGPEAAAQV